MRSSGEQVSAQLMPPGGPSNSRGGGPAGRCFCASLLPCSCPHCYLEEVGGEQGAEVSTGICDVYAEYVMCIQSQVSKWVAATKYHSMLVCAGYCTTIRTVCTLPNTHSVWSQGLKFFMLSDNNLHYNIAASYCIARKFCGQNIWRFDRNRCEN